MLRECYTLSIDDKNLLSIAKNSAFQLAEDNADRDMIVVRANEFAKEYSKEELSSYVFKNVKDQAAINRREQIPELQGDKDRVLVNFN